MELTNNFYGHQNNACMVIFLLNAANILCYARDSYLRHVEVTIEGCEVARLQVPTIGYPLYGLMWVALARDYCTWDSHVCWRIYKTWGMHRSHFDFSPE